MHIEVIHTFDVSAAEAFAYIKLLNRERALHMELESFRKDACVTYVRRQRGLPDVRHERHFEAARDGCRYRLVVEDGIFEIKKRRQK